MAAATAFGGREAVAWVLRSTEVIEAQAQALTKLDAAIGDGDHGANLTRGLLAARQQLGALTDPAPGEVFRAVSLALVGKVGGAAGPLYGSLYLGMAKQAGDAAEIDGGGLAAALRAGYESVAARGRSQPGEKTMLDALSPAIDALEAALARGEPLASALDGAAAAAAEGMRATIPMVARKGRASYLGERSRGHQDPGATSSQLLVQALADVVSNR